MGFFDNAPALKSAHPRVRVGWASAVPGSPAADRTGSASGGGRGREGTFVP